MVDFLALESTTPHLEGAVLTQFQAGIRVLLPDLIFPDKQTIYFMGNPMTFKCWKTIPNKQAKEKTSKGWISVTCPLCFEWSGPQPFFSVRLPFENSLKTIQLLKEK